MPEGEEATRECPSCKEEVKAAAVRCKHCHATLSPETPAHGGVCPFCREAIHPEAIRCRHCKSDLAPVEPHSRCQGCSSREFPVPRQMNAPGVLRVRMDAIRDRPAYRRSDCSVCPPAIMEGSTMWCLVDCDGVYCTYEQCGYV